MFFDIYKYGVIFLFFEQIYVMGCYLFIFLFGKYFFFLQGIWGGGWKFGWIGGFVWDLNINLVVLVVFMGNLYECVEFYIGYVESLFFGWRLNV